MRGIFNFFFWKKSGCNILFYDGDKRERSQRDGTEIYFERERARERRKKGGGRRERGKGVIRTEIEKRESENRERFWGKRERKERRRTSKERDRDESYKIGRDLGKEGGKNERA